MSDMLFLANMNAKGRLESCQNIQQPRVYLAGPDVFYPDAVQRGFEKKRMLAEFGFTGVYPLDQEIPNFQPDEITAMQIARTNEEFMDSCAIMLANMREWHGPSMDAGTAFEMGYMSAKAKYAAENILIVGYVDAEHDDLRNFKERVVDLHYDGRAMEQDGSVIGDDGMALENFGLRDNLMLMQAIKKTGGEFFYSFSDAVSNLPRLLACKNRMTDVVAPTKAPAKTLAESIEPSPGDMLEMHYAGCRTFSSLI